MFTSYVLSRTLVPTMVHYLLAAEVEIYGGQLDPQDPHSVHRARPAGSWLGRRYVRLALMLLACLLAGAVFATIHVPHDARSGLAGRVTEIARAAATHRVTIAGWLLTILGGAGLLWSIEHYGLIWRVHARFDRCFESLRRLYGGLLAWSLAHRPTVVFAFTVLVVGSCWLLFPRIGTDFFPSVDAGQIRLHVRCPAGTRIEETNQYFARIAETIREVIPPNEVATILDNIGVPYSGINLSLSDGSMISPADGEILVSLREGHGSTDEYVTRLRNTLRARYPSATFFFSAPDIATQVLNFGLSAPIDVQVSGPIQNAEANRKIAAQLSREVARLPGVVDVRLQQVPRTPDLRVDVDRTMASQMGLTQKDVASSLLISLSSSNQTAPNFWLNPVNGVNYSIYVQTPQYAFQSINDLENTPIVPSAGPTHEAQLLSNVASVGRFVSATNVTHSNIMPCFNVLMGVQYSDLGSVSRLVQKVVADFRDKLPRGTQISVRGQVESMSASFTGLAYGLIFAVILVYLLMVINFQSWLDPLIILMALPGAAAGILWMLWATATTICVPALMGAIMSIGVATANSILLITFANDQRKEGHNAHDAALLAGLTRLRPVIMTALAMIIGMLPMALGRGEGGEQNAPLGRAVIGGLTLATFATLFFVPVVYSLLRTRPPQTQIEEELRS
jgi:multidrug efflux pump subunit AcrB